jgi:hypothetical protein
MDSIEVSNTYVRKGSHVKLTDEAKTKKTEGVLTYKELINDMYNIYKVDYLLVTFINNKTKTITVIIPGDKDGSYSIFEPMHLECIDECIDGPQTPPPPPYNKKRFKRTRRNNRKRKTRRSSNRK